MMRRRRVFVVLAAAAAVLTVAALCPVDALGTAPASRPATAPAIVQPAEIEPPRLTSLEAVVLGVVEGITEYLPVSSTGHLILVSDWMGLQGRVEAIEAFEIVIQLGAVLAVLGLYRKRVRQMVSGLSGRNPAGLRLAGLLLVAFLPAAVVGLSLHKHIKAYLFGAGTVCAALVVGGVAMIVIEQFAWRRRKDVQRTTNLDDVRFRQALVIGVAQCLAMWPGTSRSMVTILAGLIVGLDMITAAEFSFLLALPTLGAATVYEAVKGWDGLMVAAGPEGLAIGLVVSGLVAALTVKLLIKWLTHHGLMPFGLYRILLGLLVYLCLLRQGRPHIRATLVVARLLFAGACGSFWRF